MTDFGICKEIVLQSMQQFTQRWQPTIFLQWTYIYDTHCMIHTLIFHIHHRVVFDEHIAFADLTHWGQDKLAAISQTTISNVFSGIKMYEFRLIFYCVFLRVKLIICHHWFRQWLGADQAIVMIEIIYIVSYYHHQIGSMIYYPLFRVRSWNNGMRCMFLYILMVSLLTHICVARPQSVNGAIYV